MKILVEKNTLVDALTKNVRNTSSQKETPILEGIYMKAEDNCLRIIRSNVDETVVITLPAENENLKIKEAGEVVVHRSLSEITKQLKETITLEATEKSLRITSGDSEFELPIYDATQYPELAQEEGEDFIDLTYDEFKDIVEKSTYCANFTSEVRPILKGVHFRKEGNQIMFVSTNSHVLVRKIVDYKPREGQNDPGSFQLVPPAPSLMQALRFFQKEDKLSLSLGKHYLIIQSEHVSCRIRLIEGNYPDVDRLISTKFKSLVKIERKKLIDAVEQARLLITAKNIILTITIKDNMLAVRTSTELGKCNIPVSIQEIQGEPEVEISLNVNYLRDHIRTMDAEVIQLGFSGPSRPVVILNEEKDGEYRLLLPVRTVSS
ncbi:DNA polymerase III subunit beta [Pseudobacillus sp. 179-B 2D1 NHS]|uniref:DNA polymerase III subunit beta n=1 Tax=Pseudobacillus sp. 179-B 2D1 NHS TaxID=3374292 RepID=UPI0038793212